MLKIYFAILCFIFLLFGIFNNTDAKCNIKQEIRAIYNGNTLINRIPVWSKRNALNANCYYEIGRSCFFLFVKNHEQALLTNALDFLAFSSKNLSRHDSIYNQCHTLNAYVNFLYGFQPDFITSGYNPVTYLNDELAKDCIHYQITVEKEILFKQALIMNQYYHAAEVLQQNPSSNAFENMFHILASIKKMDTQKMTKIRAAYQSWQQYFFQLKQIHQKGIMDCHMYERAINALYLAKTILPFVKDNRNVCKSYAHCRFNACQNAMRNHFTKHSIAGFQYDEYLATWRKNYNHAIAICEENKQNPLAMINDYVNQVNKLFKSTNHIQTKE